jgi:hypothetical protein
MVRADDIPGAHDGCAKPALPEQRFTDAADFDATLIAGARCTTLTYQKCEIFASLRTFFLSVKRSLERTTLD